MLYFQELISLSLMKPTEKKLERNSKHVGFTLMHKNHESRI